METSSSMTVLPAPESGPVLSSEPSLQRGIAAWLDTCESVPVHPGALEEQLRRAGWPSAPIAAVVSEYHRRFNEHILGYTALLVTTGLAALGAGTAGHLLVAGLDGPVDRDLLAGSLTVLVCTLPFAIWGHLWARHTDRDDPVAVWSRPRRWLATSLLWGCCIIGIGRLLFYAGQLVGVITGASWAAGVSLAVGTLNVAITVSIALPLGLWSYAFLH